MGTSGAPTATVQVQGRWKSAEMVHRYVRSMGGKEIVRFLT